VVPIPGPCAAIAALTASGLRSDLFVVLGFLPRSGTARAEALASLSRSRMTAVLYEAGNRTGETLADLLRTIGDRPAAVARELTKVHEEIVRGRLSELAQRFSAGARGEVTLIVEGRAGAGGDEAMARAAGAGTGGAESEPLEAELLRRKRAGERPSQIAREVAKARRLKRSDVYAALQKLNGS
jgi:16S rRNA (cytidine1402-2'-O)-methyltransferase